MILRYQVTELVELDVIGDIKCTELVELCEKKISGKGYLVSQ